jgi:hypothetical protein
VKTLRFSKPLLAGLLAASTVAAASSLTYALTGSGAAEAAADGPEYAVEDFAHPDADRILAENGIKVLRGDGHIFFAECDGSPKQILVWSRKAEDGTFCFQSTTTTGFLKVEVPDVYALQTGDRAVHAELSAEDRSQEVELTKNDFQGVGEGTGGAPTVLLEIRVTA